MHITMAYLASIGKLYGDGGLFDILTESDVYAEGTARQLLQGKQLARGIRSIKLASEALFRLFWKAMQSWLEKKGKCAITGAQEQLLRDVQHACHGNDKATAQQLICEVETELTGIQNIIKTFIVEGAKQSATFGYWLMFLKGADLLLRILRSEREADFQLHLNSMCEVIPWFRAAGRTNYAKYMPVYVAEMKALEHEQQKHTHSCKKADLLSNGQRITASTVWHWRLIRHWSKPLTEKARVRVELLASHCERQLSQDG
ncbi:hypothetical protein CgunFtcFv8_002238 [Champsocephalus gunnari]|uniref:Uncharacterized protein n=1 Tax=Champsocephalus gunnari TaxID=52237 RepID=A0AAN8H870_CHAGU|nr:hypothetical protein CgunFtcFv8_002238 [Champsocephalus gunnari]